jgi:hypothetical protein
MTRTYNNILITALCVEYNNTVINENLIYVNIQVLCSNFPAGDPIQDIQRCNEIGPMLLPVCEVATVVRAICNPCSRVFRCH